MQEPSPSSLQSWLLAVRPKTLPAAVGPVVVGSGVALGEGHFSLLPALACLLGAMLLQIGVNLANDYFDYKNNIDSEERLGPVRVTQSGLIAPAVVKMGMIISLALASLVFLYLSFIGGPVIAVIGIGSVLAALGYSGGPFPLASNGLGELFVFIFFGLVAVGGTYFVQAGQLTWLAMAAAVPPGLLITAIMVVNNLRDIDTDRKAGKRSLAVILGRKGTIIEYKLLLLLSYLVPGALYISGHSSAVMLLPFFTLPMALGLVRKIDNESGRSLNTILAATAKLSLLYSLLFSVGLVFGIS